MLRNPLHLSFVSILFASLAVGTPSAAAAGPEAPVVGGTPAPSGRWPDVAAVLLRDGLCSGTLIAPDVVLTAAHCIDGVPLEVVLDSVDYARTGGERIRVAWSLAYPDWQHRYDAGVIVLEHPAQTRPRRVAARCTAREQIFAGQSVLVAGFGMTGFDDTAPNTRLNEGWMSITDPTCTHDLACQPSIAPDGEFMAGGRGVDACFGDSGGPVFLDTAAGPALIGIVSRGLSLPGAPCGNGGVYVRADRVAAWVERVTGRRLARTSCEGRADAPDEADDGGGCAAGRGGAGAAFGLVLLGAIAVGRARRRPERL
jgi:secreted trypsin-like serine protease